MHILTHQSSTSPVLLWFVLLATLLSVSITAQPQVCVTSSDCPFASSCVAGRCACDSSVDPKEAVREFYNSTYNVPFDQIVSVSLSPYLYNLQRFQAVFAPSLSVRLNPQLGLVDQSGLYLICTNSELVVTGQTDEVSLIESNSSPFPAGINVFSGTVTSNNAGNNLNFYIDSYLNPVYIDTPGHRYALTGGQVVPTCSASQQPTEQAYFSLYENLPVNFSGVPSNVLQQDIQSLPHFVDGLANAPKVLYAFGDPNCIYCHYLYEGTKQYVASGLLQIHWTLVPIIELSSFGKSWAIYDGAVPSSARSADYPSTPAGAWHYNEDHFNELSEQGGIAPQTSDEASAYAIGQLSEGVAGFDAFSLFGTPNFFFTNAQTGQFVDGGFNPDPSTAGGERYYAFLLSSIASQ